jgi:glycosyltransferase involved in cell wall biosynthesis
VVGNETIQEASPSSREPMRKKWQIAWVHNGNAGGSKRFAFEMVRNLSARGHVIDEFIVRGSESNGDYLPLKPFVRTSSEIIMRNPDLSWLRPYLLSLYAQLGATLWTMRKVEQEFERLVSVINATEYDFVHIDQYPTCRAVGILPYLRRPSVVYSHQPSSVPYEESSRDTSLGQNSARKGFYRSLCDTASNLSTCVLKRRVIIQTKLAHLILTNSYYSKEILFQRYGCHSRVCYSGVDTEEFRPTLLTVEPMVLSVGRIVRQKQHNLVVEAVGMIEKDLRPHVVIATTEHIEHPEDSCYTEELRCMAKDYSVDLTFRYRPSQPELSRLYSQAMALVFVPIMEAFGLVALEAMAAGTPVIGVKEAGIRESVIDGVTGILVDRDASQIAAAITQLQQHKETRDEMSKRAVEHVRARWTWERTVDRYEDEVRKLLSSRGHP